MSRLGLSRRGGRRSLIVQALAALLIIAGFSLAAANSQTAGGARTAYLIDIDGAIGPATASYVSSSLAEAAERNAALVVLRMNTPGGLDASMRDIILDILASPVPVAVHVAPSGSRAASAGTYILYAAHISAMAPGTTLGAATPVQIGAASPFGEQPTGDDESDSGNDEEARAPAPSRQGGAMEAKTLNDSIAYIRALAELRGRNAEWAELAVREAATLTASAAAREGVIDFVANDLDDLFAQAHGRTVTAGGAETVLDLENLRVERIEPGWRTQFLAVITDPNIAVLLMMFGLYGLIFEFLNPGSLYPGVIGAICLLIGLYAMAVLPISFAGAALMLLGLALMIAEGFAPSFGVLGIGGVIAFVFGAAILIEPGTPGFAISWPAIAGTAAGGLILSLVAVRLAVKSHRRRIATGRESLIGATARVLDWAGGAGHVFVQGERWRAVSRHPVQPGQTVRVTGLNGLVLEIAAEETS